MNILLVDHAPFFGGAESFLLDLLTALDRQAFTPIIVTDPRSPVLERFVTIGEHVVTTPLPQINRSPIFPWRLLDAGAHLARVARNERADVLHTFTARAHLIGAVAARMASIPIVWRICDDTLPAWALSLFARIPQRIVIVAVSRWITRYYPRLHLDGLVPDGARPPIDVSREHARAKLDLPRDALIVAHVGRLVRWKGQDIFIRALAQAAQTVPQVRGLIVGAWHKEDERSGPLGGGKSYYDELSALADQLAAPVAFAGFVREPGYIYAAADVVTHTSTSPEPFGRIVIEAMMAGCAVVAANAGALPEIVMDGQTGILTPPGDANALANALADLLTDANRRAQMGAAGKQRAETEYTLATMTHRMENTYRLAFG